MWSLYVLFTLFHVARFKGIPEFVTRTYDVGESITLKCPRRYSSTYQVTLHWIRFLSGNFPEYLGSTFLFDYDVVNKTPHFTTKQGKGTFDLIIDVSKITDTGFYYCVKGERLKMESVSGTFLKINGPDSALSVKSPELSGTVDSGDSVDLQCWVQTENVQCIEEHMVLWFRSGLDQSSPGLVFAQWNTSDQCNRNTEDHGPHKCFYTFSKTMSRSDAGTYRCAVAACGQITFGNRVEVSVTVSSKKNIWDLHKANTVLVLLSTVFGLICLTCPLCWTMKKLNKPGKDHSKEKLQVMTKKEDCDAALCRTIEAAETDSVYTYVTFVYVK